MVRQKTPKKPRAIAFANAVPENHNEGRNVSGAHHAMIRKPRPPHQRMHGDSTCQADAPIWLSVGRANDGRDCPVFMPPGRFVELKTKLLGCHNVRSAQRGAARGERHRGSRSRPISRWFRGRQAGKPDQQRTTVRFFEYREVRAKRN